MAWFSADAVSPNISLSDKAVQVWIDREVEESCAWRPVNDRPVAMLRERECVITVALENIFCEHWSYLACVHSDIKLRMVFLEKSKFASVLAEIVFGRVSIASVMSLLVHTVRHTSMETVFFGEEAEPCTDPTLVIGQDFSYSTNDETKTIYDLTPSVVHIAMVVLSTGGTARPSAFHVSVKKAKHGFFATGGKKTPRITYVPPSRKFSIEFKLRPLASRELFRLRVAFSMYGLNVTKVIDTIAKYRYSTMARAAFRALVCNDYFDKAASVVQDFGAGTAVEANLRKYMTALN